MRYDFAAFGQLVHLLALVHLVRTTQFGHKLAMRRSEASANELDDSLESSPSDMDSVLLMQMNPLQNLTRPGKVRGSNGSLNRAHKLLARQNVATCTNPGWIQACPANEQNPCCDPNYPVCCHDPSDTCCPNGTFCTGLRTCCVIGAVGCGESCCPGGVACCNNACCPNASYICDTTGGTPTCVDPSGASSTSVETVSQVTQQSAEPTSYSTSSPTSSPSKKNNTALIAGSVGGGVGALLILAALAFFLLRKKPSKPKTNGTANVEPKNYATQNTNITPFTGPTPPPNHPNGVMTAYNTSHTPPISSPGVTSPHGNTTNFGRPFSVSTYVHSSHNNPLSPNGSTYGHGTGSGAPTTYVPPPSSHATTPPLPEGGANYYANTPIPHIGGGSSTAGTNQPSSYTPSSPPTTVYSEAPLLPGGNSNNQPVWASHTPPPQPNANENVITPYGVEAMSPPRGVMSPPPPFSPSPEGRGGANNNNTAGHTPWAIPPDATEQQGHYAYDTSLLGDPSQTSSSAIPAGRVIPSNAPTDRKARPTVGR